MSRPPAKRRRLALGGYQSAFSSVGDEGSLPVMGWNVGAPVDGQSMEISGNGNIGGLLTVGSLSVSGSETIGSLTTGSLHVTGTSALDGTATAGSLFSFSAGLSCTGAAQFAGGAPSLKTDTFQVTGSSTEASLHVTGTSALDGAVTCGSGLTAGTDTGTLVINLGTGTGSRPITIGGNTGPTTLGVRGTVNMGTLTDTNTISIGTGTGARPINIGGTTGPTATTLLGTLALNTSGAQGASYGSATSPALVVSATAGVQVPATCTAMDAAATGGVVTMFPSASTLTFQGPAASTINIGDNGRTLNLGGTGSASAATVTINAGNQAHITNINTGVTGSGAVHIGDGASSSAAIHIGDANGSPSGAGPTNAITIGQASGTNGGTTTTLAGAINIGTDSKTQTIAIGTGSGARAINIGSATGPTTTTIAGTLAGSLTFSGLQKLSGGYNIGTMPATQFLQSITVNFTATQLRTLAGTAATDIALTGSPIAGVAWYPVLVMWKLNFATAVNNASTGLALWNTLVGGTVHTICTASTNTTWVNAGSTAYAVSTGTASVGDTSANLLNSSLSLNLGAAGSVTGTATGSIDVRVVYFSYP